MTRAFDAGLYRFAVTVLRVVVRVFPGVHVTGAEHLATLRPEFAQLRASCGWTGL